MMHHLVYQALVPKDIIHTSNARSKSNEADEACHVESCRCASVVPDHGSQ